MNITTYISRQGLTQIPFDQAENIAPPSFLSGFMACRVYTNRNGTTLVAVQTTGPLFRVCSASLTYSGRKDESYPMLAGFSRAAA
jgi:hypothetical protein